MLFREFNIIAAAAYAAEAAHRAEFRPLWEELSDDERMVHTQMVMAIARGDEGCTDQVYVATAKAILDFNGGQGGLALEELAGIGGTVLNLELLTEEEVADRNIRETVVELLNELAERRQTPSGSGGDVFRSNPRYRALEFAARVDGAIESARTFEAFIHDGEGGVSSEAARLLDVACQGAPNGANAEDIVAAALSYSTYLHELPQPETGPVAEQNGSEELPVEQAETVQ